MSPEQRNIELRLTQPSCSQPCIIWR